MLAQAHASAPCRHDEGVAPELADLCVAATSADPAMRPPTPLAFRQAIVDFLRHRGSIALAEAARERSGEIQAQSDGTSEGRRRLYRLLGECRFGFEQALREWSDNTAAKEGLQSCLEAQIGQEIADENSVSARAILAELPEARPALAARIDALEEALRRRRDRESELERMAHDLDLGVGASSRTMLFIGVAVATALLSVWGVHAVHTYGFSYQQSLLAPGGLFLCTLAGAIVGRKRLVNSINRRMIALVLATTAAMFLHRLIFMRLDAPEYVPFVADLLLTGLASTAAAIALVPSLGWIAAVLFLGAAAVAVWPSRAPEILTASVVASALVLGVIQRRWGRPHP